MVDHLQAVRLLASASPLLLLICFNVRLSVDVKRERRHQDGRVYFRLIRVFLMSRVMRRGFRGKLLPISSPSGAMQASKCGISNSSYWAGPGLLSKVSTLHWKKILFLVKIHCTYPRCITGARPTARTLHHMTEEDVNYNKLSVNGDT